MSLLKYMAQAGDAYFAKRQTLKELAERVKIIDTTVTEAPDSRAGLDPKVKEDKLEIEDPFEV